MEALEAPPPEPPPSSGPRKLIDLFPPAQPEAEAAPTQLSTPEPPAAIGLLANTTPAPSWRGGFMIMVVLLVLMFAGAAGAGWIFREPLTRAMTRWHLTR